MVVHEFRRDFEGRFAEILSGNEALATHTTLRVGGEADYLCMPRSVQETQDVTAFLTRHDVARFMLGGGSNLLVRDAGFRGVVINLSAINHLAFDGERVSAGAGVPLAKVCSRAMKKSLAGLEPLVGIPGTIGGALFMNAGGRHGDMAAVTESALVVDRQGKLSRLDPDAIGFAYRKTGLAGLTVLEVTLRLAQGEKREILRRMTSILKAKQVSQPMGEWSAGCVFKNPDDGRAAAFLIDRAGLKGRRQGDACVSERHANFIVNEGKAQAKDVLRLISGVRREVLARYGAPLRLEVQVLGEQGLETH
ncbi:MAG: UDP-N-acetylmuramate dehydrogenase [Planctomycetota bacterium]